MERLKLLGLGWAKTASIFICFVPRSIERECGCSKSCQHYNEVCMESNVQFVVMEKSVAIKVVYENYEFNLHLFGTFGNILVLA